MNPDFNRTKKWIEDLKQSAPSRDAGVRGLYSFKTSAINSIAGWWNTEDEAERRMHRHRLNGEYLYEVMALERVLMAYWQSLKSALIICALSPAMLNQLRIYACWPRELYRDLDWTQRDLDARHQRSTFSETESILHRIGQLVVVLQQFEG